MADDEKSPVKMGAEPVILGKKWAGEKFSTVRSAEAVAAIHKLQAEYDVEGAVPIEAWFNARNQREPTMIAAMLAYTSIRKATHDAFDEIFATF